MKRSITQRTHWQLQRKLDFPPRRLGSAQPTRGDHDVLASVTLLTLWPVFPTAWASEKQKTVFWKLRKVTQWRELEKGTLRCPDVPSSEGPQAGQCIQLGRGLGVRVPFSLRDMTPQLRNSWARITLWPHSKAHLSVRVSKFPDFGGNTDWVARYEGQLRLWRLPILCGIWLCNQTQKLTTGTASHGSTPRPWRADGLRIFYKLKRSRSKKNLWDK